MAPLITREAPRPLADLVLSFLPAQGSFEVQHDEAGKTHNWHRHSITEYLYVVEGELELFWREDGSTHRETVGPASRILLPAATLHGSTARPGGCTYFIAPENGATAVTTFLAETEYPES